MFRFPHLRVSGDGFQRGVAYGRAAHHLIRGTVEFYEQTLRERSGWTWDRVSRFASRFEPFLSRVAPKQMAEIHGIAEGANMDRYSVLAVNLRTEILRASGAQPQRECTAFAVLGGGAPEGHMLLGQNWDWFAGTAPFIVILEVRPDSALQSITIVEAGLLAKTGMNAAGLGIATNALATEGEPRVPGMPYHFLLESLIAGGDIDDALITLSAHHRASAANYLVASADGRVVDIEAAPGGPNALRASVIHDHAVVHANHFLAPPAGRQHPATPASADSLGRHARLAAKLASLPSSVVDHVFDALADHDNYPYSVCSHADPEKPTVEQSATNFAVVYDLTDRVVWLAHGQPCTHSFERLEVDWPVASP